jgi:carbonic anhydrase
MNMNATPSTIRRENRHGVFLLFNLIRNALNRPLLTGGLLLALLFAAGGQTSNPDETGTAMFPPARTKEEQAAMTPEQALAELEAGNDRFIAGRSQIRDLPAKARATASGQYPFAVILSCLDSRQPIEIIFDQGIGDVFSARVAGNVLNDDILGSMEFACKVSGAKLIAVIGHSNCGAIKGAIDSVQLGHLTGLLDKIKPAIDAVPDNGQPRDSKNPEFVDKVAEANVRLVMRQIREHSPILRQMLDERKIGMVGGMYDISTGKVRFFPN